MNDFQVFRDSITEETLSAWDKEVRSKLIPRLDQEYAEDPAQWNLAFTQSYAFQMSLHLLEAYHNWSNRN